MSASPFLLPDHPGYAEILTDAAVHVLATRGVDRFSVAAMARWMKVTPEAINQRYSRSRVIGMVTERFAVRWLRWSGGDYEWLREETPCPIRLPRTSEERHGMRVLLALAELAEGERVMGNPIPTGHLARLRDEEAELVRTRLAELAPSTWTEPDRYRSRAHALLAVATGLRHALCLRPAALTADCAARLLAQAVAAAVSPATGEPTTDRDRHPPHEPAA